MSRRSSIPALACLALGPVVLLSAPAAGQDDVEQLGRIHGTRPPAAYYELKAARPDAFTFDRAWKRRNPRLRELPPAVPGGPPRWRTVEIAPPRSGGASGGSEDGLSTMAALGPREGGVQGTVRVPLVLGLFSDSPLQAPFTRERVHQEMFAGPSSRVGTITEYYDEVSGGRVELLGDTWGWVRSGMTEDSVTAGVSGLGGPAPIGEYIIQLLVEVDGQGMDWGVYDNDGPDGVPNSGDDDGYVDILAVMHPNYGAECGGSGQSDRIWSHKWSLRGASGQDYVTGTPRAGGGFIRVNDYTVQPVKSCDGTTIGEIGVLAHELGHGFGLPDLYDTAGRHQGIGRWGLMGSGSWGCSVYEPERPCHMSAWSKAVLGWVDVETLPADADLGTLSLDPVGSSGTVYRWDGPPGSGEYFLMENRQRTGYDLRLLEEGLLVWRVDDDLVSSSWGANRVNTDGNRMGVHLVQPDGRNDLGTRNGNRGDGGDVFPGLLDATAFHSGSAPASRTREGELTGLTLTDIRMSGDRVQARALTRFVEVAVRSGGEGAEAASLTVDDQPVGVRGVVLTSAPFAEHVLEAGPGGEVEDGVRVGFLGWDDDPEAPRARTFVTGFEGQTVVARYGGREIRLAVSVEGEAYGVSPGSVEVSAPVRPEGDHLWVLAEDPGDTVTVEAVPTTGFQFLAWSGALEGRPNPAEIPLDGPRDIGARFELVYGVVSASHEVEAARNEEVVLSAEHANAPVRWTVVEGTVPEGLTFHETGRITGSALEGGVFSLTLRAVDALGLTATGTLELTVAPPVISLGTLAGPFLLTGDALTVAQRTYLDRHGNGSGLYDLGDFRAFLLANPGLPTGPMTAAEQALVRSVVPMFDFRRDAGGGVR